LNVAPAILNHRRVDRGFEINFALVRVLDPELFTHWPKASAARPQKRAAQLLGVEKTQCAPTVDAHGAFVEMLSEPELADHDAGTVLHEPERQPSIVVAARWTGSNRKRPEIEREIVADDHARHCVFGHAFRRAPDICQPIEDPMKEFLTCQEGEPGAPVARGARADASSRPP